MAKWYGQIGFGETTEVERGIYKFVITEHPYYGDLSSQRYSAATADQINDDVKMTNTLSIVADPYAMEHCGYMKYVVIHNCLWKVNSVEIQYPRLVIQIGGVYNGDTARTPNST